jgi:hypothetical protein
MILEEKIELMIKIQNIHLIKFIAFSENWDYLEMCKKYLK